jgi:hypothetical protein
MKTHHVIILSVVALLLARVPFFFHNPDWGMVATEHCFFLVHPDIHAHRQALSPDEHVPFWTVNPKQIKLHFHAGAAWMSHAVRLLHGVLGIRSLVLLKIVGTALTAAFVGLLAWALTRVWVRPEERACVLIPLFACVFPPSWFLWFGLTPQGHYTETYFFYALMLPFMVAEARGHLRWRGLLALGVLGGLATAYTFSNAGLVLAVVSAHLLLARYPLLGRIRDAAVSCAVTAATFLLVGRPGTTFRRLSHGLFHSGEDGAGEAAQAAATTGMESASALDAVRDHVAMLFGFHRTGMLDVSDPGLGFAVALLLAGVALYGGVVLAAQALRLVHPRLRATSTPAERFLGINGIVAAAFVLAYLAFDPYTGPHEDMNKTGNLMTTFPALFVGVGGALGSAARTIRLPLRLVAVAVSLLCGVLLVVGWIGALRTNARTLDRPEFGPCDCVHVDGYFWDPPGDSAPRGILDPIEPRFDRIAGEARCQASIPEGDELCAFTGWALAAHLDTEGGCAHAPEEQRELCAQAFGAVKYGQDTCMAPTTPADDLCAGFTGELRRACVSGAYQSAATQYTVYECPASLLGMCDATFTDPVAFSACAEQLASLQGGMPLLPTGGPVPDPSCTSWPEPWIGLCERAVAIAALSPPGQRRPACEDVYRERFAEDVPDLGRVYYDQCLSLTTESYPWCAVGVARLRGEADCAWRGEFAAGTIF